MPLQLLRLPQCTTAAPEDLRHWACLDLHSEALPHSGTPAQAQQLLKNALAAERGTRINAVLGSEHTPGLWWLLAAQYLPKVPHWYYNESEQRWHCLSPDTAQPVPVPVPPAPTVAAIPASAPPAPQAPAKPPAKPPVQALPSAAAPVDKNDPAQLRDAELIAKAFRLSAWGSKPEYQRELADIEREAAEGNHRPAYLFKQVQSARRNGEKAFALNTQMLRELQQGAQHALAWIDKTTANLHEKVAQHLHLQLDKELKYQQAKQHRHAQPPQYQSSVSVNLVNGQHPNSLRHLAPAAHWRVYIDETGQTFDDRADGLSSNDKDVGKLVAVAIPAGVNLPALPKFHGTEADGKETDAVLQRLLDAKVGILGFSVHDHSARHSYWLGHVLHLVRWVLLQLPVSARSEQAADCQVQVFIEQNCGFTPADSLRIVSQTLESEFKDLDPERFGSLALRLEFMDKKNPYNGYVDAVAYTWGSPAALSKDRLKKSALRGHCLIDSSERSLHHLYLSLSERIPLAPADWYALCTAASTDPAQGFLARALERIGQDLAKTPGQWQAYLSQVQQRLAAKQYRLAELGHALDWLEHWAPNAQKLPATLRLLLLSSKLAMHNHQGRIDEQLLVDCLALVNTLEDESPEQCCEALLRIATATTNYFEFGALRDIINAWLAKPVGIAGLLNYGKLHSTLGQIEAFEGRPAAALAHFDQALAHFARLSDPQQSQRESTQTRSYRLIAQLDSPATTPDAAITSLLAHFNAQAPDALSRKLAHSGQDARFQQYLWLRAMVHLPDALATARAAYCQSQGQWQGGQDHPWPLICAYRGWLLHDAGQHSAASEQLQWAIEDCTSAGHGLTLAWMAEVLRTLAQALGIALAGQAPSAQSRTALAAALPHAPQSALAQFAAAAAQAHSSCQAVAHPALLQHLAQCLPFNFH